MKNLIIVVFALVSMFSCQANTKKSVPDKVLTAFQQKFPNAEKTKWSKEDATEWEAEFKLYGIKYSANFKEDGSWVETEYSLLVKNIPTIIQSAISNNYPGYEIEGAEVSETASHLYYEIEIEKDRSELEIIIDKSGKIIEQKNAEDEED